MTSLLLTNASPCCGAHSGFFWFPAQVNKVSTEKLIACMAFDYVTFGQWGVQAAFDISNIWPLKVNYSKKGQCCMLT
jgi:hypothetical protein